MQRTEYVAHLVETSQARLIAVDADLEAIAAELAEKTIAEEPDTKTLRQLVNERSKLLQERELLILRLNGLEQQRREAEQSEARERASVIEQELTAVATQGEDAHKKFLTLRQQMLTLLEQIHDLGKRRAELRAESGYLHETFETPWSQTRTAPEPRADDVWEIQQAIKQLLFVDSAGGVSWCRKTDAIRDQKTAAARREQQEHQKNSRPMIVQGGYESSEAVIARQYAEPPRPPPPNYMQKLQRGED